MALRGVRGFRDSDWSRGVVGGHLWEGGEWLGSIQGGCTEEIVVNQTLSNSLKSEDTLRTSIPDSK